MRIQVQVRWLPKQGNAEHEYEDAYRWIERDDADRRAVICAVADGATEAVYAGLWARLVVDAYCEEPFVPGNLAEVLPPIQEQWLREAKQSASSSAVAWIAEMKIAQGSFASLLGFVAVPGADVTGGSWIAVAVGDTCVFQIRQDQLITLFPIGSSDQFGTHPHLISTNPQHISRLAADLQVLEGDGIDWLPGDVFFLMTDALACWFLQQVEAGEKPWTNLRKIFLSSEMSDFECWVDQARASGQLKNDDSTVVRVLFG